MPAVIRAEAYLADMNPVTLPIATLCVVEGEANWPAVLCVVFQFGLLLPVLFLALLVG